MDRRKTATRTPAPIFAIKKPRQALVAHPGNENSIQEECGSDLMTGMRYVAQPRLMSLNPRVQQPPPPASMFTPAIRQPPPNLPMYNPSSLCTNSRNRPTNAAPKSQLLASKGSVQYRPNSLEKSQYFQPGPTANNFLSDNSFAKPRSGAVAQSDPRFSTWHQPGDGFAPSKPGLCNPMAQPRMFGGSQATSVGKRPMQFAGNERSQKPPVNYNKPQLQMAQQSTSQQSTSQQQTSRQQTSRQQTGQQFPQQQMMARQQKSQQQWTPTQRSTNLFTSTQSPYLQNDTAASVFPASNSMFPSCDIVQENKIPGKTFSVDTRNSTVELRMLTCTIDGMKYWSEKKEKMVLLFEVFGTLNSAVSNDSKKDAVEFSLKDGQDSVDCIFYQIDRQLPRLTRGQCYRCVGRYDVTTNSKMVCVSVRLATDVERRLHGQFIVVSNRVMQSWMHRNFEA